MDLAAVQQLRSGAEQIPTFAETIDCIKGRSRMLVANSTRNSIVWPAAADREQIAEARECGLQVRCGFRDDLGYDETYGLLCEFADLGVSEFSCGRPDWMGRMIAAYLSHMDL